MTYHRDNIVEGVSSTLEAPFVPREIVEDAFVRATWDSAPLLARAVDAFAVAFSVVGAHDGRGLPFLDARLECCAMESATRFLGL